MLRGISMLFQGYLAGIIGPEGIGLVQLILTVGGLAMTFGLSGLRVSAMYLCAQEYGSGRPAGMQQAMRCCLRAGAVISALAALGLYLASDYAAVRWICDARAAQALRYLALFLPVSCICAILSGFFTACDRIGQLARVEIAERLASVGLTYLLLRLWAADNAARACSAIVLGSSLACLGSTAVLFAMYRSACRAYGALPKRLPMWGRLTRLCVPLALNAYLRAGLSSLEQFLIPWGLERAGRSYQASMAAYGTIHGMVFPILMFPAAIVYALADLLVPELARCRAEENARRIHHLTRTCLRMGLLFALSVASLMTALSDELGMLIYKSADAGRYLRVFAPMALMLYMDAMVDGMHKGLGEQVACVRYNTITSFLDVVLLYMFLPRYGIESYIVIFALTHAVNFYLSLRRLLLVTGYRMDLRFPARAAFCAASACLAGFCIPRTAMIGTIALRAGAYLAVFVLFLDLTGTFTAYDRRWLCHALGGNR